MRTIFVLLSALVAIAPEVSAQITNAEFRQRRDSLTARLPQDAVVIAFGERDKIGFPAFYQSPNFRYLTGLSEPNAVLVITGREPSGHSVGTLFRQDRAPSDILFNGPLEDAAQVMGRMNLAVRPLAELVPVVESLIAAGRPLYMVRDTRPYGGTTDTLTRGSVFASALRLRTPAPTIRSADNEILALRGRKSAAEEQLVRRSADITAKSVNNAILHDGRHEVDLIVERPDHRVLAIEVKLSGTIDDNAVEHLKWLQEKMGPDLLDAVVICSGPQAYRRRDGIAVVPAVLLGP